MPHAADTSEKIAERCGATLAETILETRVLAREHDLSFVLGVGDIAARVSEGSVAYSTSSGVWLPKPEDEGSLTDTSLGKERLALDT